MSSAPDRSADVAAICATHPEAFPQTDQNDAARLVLLRGVIIPALNRLDGGAWGYLTKTDQGGKVPCDVMVWRDTLEVFDCLTGSGGCWIAHGPPPPAWVWTAVPGVVVPPPAAGGDVVADGSYAVAYVPRVFRTVPGTIVPQAGGDVVLITPAGDVVSVQPNGTIELRNGVGAWELATPIGAGLLRYDGTGHTFFLLVGPRAL